MSNWRGKLFYVAMSALLLSGAYSYAQYRGLESRYEEYLETQVLVQEKSDEVARLDREVAAEQRKVEGLENDPLEIEAAIRKISRNVRDGEIVYHLEGFPDTVEEAEALVAGMGEPSQTWATN